VPNRRSLSVRLLTIITTHIAVCPARFINGIVFPTYNRVASRPRRMSPTAVVGFIGTLAAMLRFRRSISEAQPVRADKPKIIGSDDRMNLILDTGS
jgi:hypothetical protein